MITTIATFLLFVLTLLILVTLLFFVTLTPKAEHQPYSANPAKKLRASLQCYARRRRRLLTRKELNRTHFVHIVNIPTNEFSIKQLSSRRLRLLQQAYRASKNQQLTTTITNEETKIWGTGFKRRKRKFLKCASLRITDIPEQDRYYFPVTLQNSVTLDTLLDLGSQSCIISENLFRQLPDYENIPDAGPSRACLDVGKHVIPQSRNPKLLTLTFGSVTKQHPFTVISQADEFLVGGCLVNHMPLNVLHDEQGLAHVYNGREGNLFDKTRLTNDPQSYSDLHCAQETELMPCESKLVPCRSYKTTILASDRLSLISPNPDAPVQVQEGVHDLSAKACYVLATNTSSHPVTLRDDEVLASSQPLSPDQFIDAYDGLTRGSPAGPLKINAVKAINSDLLEENEPYDPDTEAEGLPIPSECPSYDYEEEIKNNATFPEDLKQPFLDFLKDEVPGLCSSNEYDFGTLTLDHKFDIELKSNKTHTSKPYKLNFVRQQQLDYAINQLVKAGILKKGDSPYTSPAFLISKAPDKQGVSKTRVIFDMRQLNENTVKDHFPLPHIPTLLQDLKGGSFYSTLDLRGAFHNVEMTEGAKKKSAIITSSGIFLPQRMVFGLANCPSYFSYIISEVIKNLPCCRAYIDDIIIRTVSDNPEDHLRDIQAVLRRLHEAGMRVNVLKGTYFAQEVEFLGKVLNKDGIRPLTKHVEAIQNFPRPTTRKTLQRFLGLVAWVSCFIYNFSHVTKPLTKLVGRRIHYQWGDEQEEAFLNIKSLISSRCISYHPDFEEPFYLASDVCKDSYGSILYQVKSYSEKDIPALTAIQERNSNPPSSVSTNHPVLPSLAKGVPPALNLCKVVANDPPEFEHPPFWSALKSKVVSTLDAIPMEQKVHVIRPIGFSSCTFSGASKNYTILEKETKGLLKAIATFQQFLYCAKRSYIVTDSQSFLWTLRFKTLGISRLERMCIKLLSLPYKLIITHQKGKNLPADFMTRIWAVPSNDDGVSDINAKNAVVIKTPFPIGQVVSPEEIIQALRDDPHIIYIPTKEEIHAQKRVKVVRSFDNLREQCSSIHKVNLHSAPGEILKSLSLDRILEEQRADPKISRIISDLQQNAEAHPDYYLHAGLLYKRGKDSDPSSDGRLYIPLTLLPLLLAYYHYTSHSGYKILVKLIAPDFYSPYLDLHARRFTSSCHLCNTLKPSQHPKTDLGTIPLPAGKCQEWVMDMVVGLPRHDGYDSFLSIIDPFSGFRLAFPCRNTLSAKQAAKLLQLYVIQIFGIPKRFSSDQGPNLLKAKEFKDFLAFHGIEKHVGLPYSAKSHGRIEASNKAIQELLRILAEQHGVPWTRILHYAVLNLNSRPYAHLDNLSPFEVMFNIKHMNLKERLNFKVELYSFADHKALFDTLDGRLSKLIRDADTTLRNRKEQTTSTARSSLEAFYQPGHLVYVKDFRILPKKKFKQRFFSAPFLILKSYTHALLVKDFFGLTKLVHKDNVRPCPVREAYLFEALPTKVKQAVGFPFSNEEIEQAVLSGRIPEFWDDLPEVTEPPITRSKSYLSGFYTDHFSNPQEYLEDPDLEYLEDPNLDIYDDDEDLDFYEVDDDTVTAESPEPLPVPPARSVTFASPVDDT